MEEWVGTAINVPRSPLLSVVRYLTEAQILFQAARVDEFKLLAGGDEGCFVSRILTP